MPNHTIAERSHTMRLPPPLPHNVCAASLCLLPNLPLNSFVLHRPYTISLAPTSIYIELVTQLAPIHLLRGACHIDRVRPCHRPYVSHIFHPPITEKSITYSSCLSTPVDQLVIQLWSSSLPAPYTNLVLRSINPSRIHSLVPSSIHDVRHVFHVPKIRRVFLLWP